MVDHRFGEQDERMSVEEKMMKRFVMEKKVWLFVRFCHGVLLADIEEVEGWNFVQLG